MNLSKIFQKKSGTILVMSLWILGLLTVFALTLGQTVRQRISLISKLEQRNRLHTIAQAGVQKALAVLKAGYQTDRPFYTAETKTSRHNNPEQFSPRALGRGEFEVSYMAESTAPGGERQKFYGVRDEESKININKTDSEILGRLIQIVLGWDAPKSQKLANAIRDWREMGDSEATGFYSDEYYDNLTYPYPQKKSDFELLEELFFVKMIDKDVFEKLAPHMTVYGEGKINVNTASRVVLLALGFDPGLTTKILSVRLGKDGIEATADDYIFRYSYDLFSDLNQFFELTEDETSQINSLNARGFLGTNSFHFFIRANARLLDAASMNESACLVDLTTNRIRFFEERYYSESR